MFSILMYSINVVLYCIVLCCIALRCNVLYCTVLYCILTLQTYWTALKRAVHNRPKWSLTSGRTSFSMSSSSPWSRTSAKCCTAGRQRLSWPPYLRKIPLLSLTSRLWQLQTVTPDISNQTARWFSLDFQNLRFICIDVMFWSLT